MGSPKSWMRLRRRSPVAFALSNPPVASVLFGATSAEQVEQNVRALDVLVVASDAQLDALRTIGAPTNLK